MVISLYRNKGYDFTITSSTAFDHKWIPSRNIYERISQIVDELFDNYLSRPDVRQPILTQYCDGNRVSCPNWMTFFVTTYKHQQTQCFQGFTACSSNKPLTSSFILFVDDFFLQHSEHIILGCRITESEERISYTFFTLSSMSSSSSLLLLFSSLISDSCFSRYSILSCCTACLFSLYSSIVSIPFHVGFFDSLQFHIDLFDLVFQYGF